LTEKKKSLERWYTIFLLPVYKSVSDPWTKLLGLFIEPTLVKKGQYRKIGMYFDDDYSATDFKRQIVAGSYREIDVAHYRHVDEDGNGKLVPIIELV
jgi:hypothetical protein